MTIDQCKTVTDVSSDNHILYGRLADASAGYRHAEVIVQQRLYNFLMAASILLLAAAAILSVQTSAIRSVFVIVDSTLGFALSCAFIILGFRQGKFIELHMEIIQNLENQIDQEKYRIWEPIAKLRVGEKVIFPVSKKVIKLNKLESIVRSSNILYGAPIAFALVFLVLFFITI